MAGVAETLSVDLVPGTPPLELQGARLILAINLRRLLIFESLCEQQIEIVDLAQPDNSKTARVNRAAASSCRRARLLQQLGATAQDARQFHGDFSLWNFGLERPSDESLAECTRANVICEFRIDHDGSDIEVVNFGPALGYRLRGKDVEPGALESFLLRVLAVHVSADQEDGHRCRVRQPRQYVTNYFNYPGELLVFA